MAASARVALALWALTTVSVGCKSNASLRRGEEGKANEKARAKPEGAALTDPLLPAVSQRDADNAR